MAIYKDGILIATKVLVDDNLESDKKSRALSARQGKVLKEMVDDGLDSKIDKPEVLGDGKKVLANNLEWVEMKGGSAELDEETLEKINAIITDGDGTMPMFNNGAYREISFSDIKEFLDSGDGALFISNKGVYSQVKLKDIDGIIVNGTGTLFMANDGNYSLIPLSSISGIEQTELGIKFTFDVDTVVELIKTDNNYTDKDKIKVGKIVTDGLGDKYLADNGTYKEVDVSQITLDKIDKADNLLTADVDGYYPSSILDKTTSDKVGAIEIEGLGDKILTDDGTYKSAGELSVIDDNQSSLDFTYSSKKVDDLLNTKVKLNHLQSEYDGAVANSHKHNNKDVLDDISLEMFGDMQNVIETIKTKGDGKGFLNNAGAYVPIEGIESQINDTDLTATSTTLSASKIVDYVDNELDNYVEKVTNKGLSTHDYNDLDKAKVDKIVTTGDGKSVLANDGNYVPFDLEINDDVIADDKLYSSQKIEDRLLEVENSVEASSEGVASMWQKTFLNVKAGDVLYVHTTSDYTMNKVIVQPYKFVAGEENIVETIKTFDNSDASNFYYNPENVEFNGAMRIRDRYPLNFTYNSTEGYYESEVINKSDFVDFYGIEVS